MEELSEFLSRGAMTDSSTILQVDTTSPKQPEPIVTQPDIKDKDVRTVGPPFSKHMRASSIT